MSDMKQVKVDNWGIYFLQRLKHFFNRTDYCDLTLQFQDNAQLKVHRLVINACTEYFELLERTCEMYEDCLIMPDDLQADVVVPIVNFMYTGQLEFKQDLLERLYETSLVMNMPVLTKLLDAQRIQKTQKPPQQTYPRGKRSYPSKSFEPKQPPQKKPYIQSNKPVSTTKYTEVVMQRPVDPLSLYTPPTLVSRKKKNPPVDPRPTRYEVPAELDTDTIFEDSFCNISYESKPLMIHPETSKRYESKKPSYGIFSEASSSRKDSKDSSIIDIVECRKIAQSERLFEDNSSLPPDVPNYESGAVQRARERKDPNQLFDQIIENDGPKVTIDTNDAKKNANIDHAKIISEVLKKYPHLVKGNKNIKLKILDTPVKSEKKTTKKQVKQDIMSDMRNVQVKTEQSYNAYDESTYESEVIDSKDAARLIALGAENIKGPWICLICGTPGKALHFPTYYKFRRHLIDVHNEKPISTMCEYCGTKSNKRNYMLHHLLTKHGVQPPPQVKFPKCNHCDYIALTDSFLVKHKANHASANMMYCNVCSVGFRTSSSLLRHIQVTGHKFLSERKSNLRCIYCTKTFVRETNLYAHLKITHKADAVRDGVIDESEEEIEPMDDEQEELMHEPIRIKSEPSKIKSDHEEPDVIQYQIHNQPDGNTQLIPSNIMSKQKILNISYNEQSQNRSQLDMTGTVSNDYMDEEMDSILPDNPDEEIVLPNAEFVQNSNQEEEQQYYVEVSQPRPLEIPTTSNVAAIAQPPNLLKRPNTNEIQFVVSNEEEYKQLMTSNHSIIFDAEGNATKTLAVLTTPQSTINPSTEINNTQTNDMVILPNNYPINVSEAVSTSNANIVVVYSQQVGDENKQFIVNSSYGQPEILSAQNIGTHYLQTSAVCRPVQSSIPTVVSGTEQGNSQHSMIEWQANGSQVGNKQAPDNGENVTDSSIVNLPEIQLMRPPDQIVDSANVQENQQIMEMEIINAENLGEQVTESEPAIEQQEFVELASAQENQQNVIEIQQHEQDTQQVEQEILQDEIQEVQDEQEIQHDAPEHEIQDVQGPELQQYQVEMSVEDDVQSQNEPISDEQIPENDTGTVCEDQYVDNISENCEADPVIEAEEEGTQDTVITNGEVVANVVLPEKSKEQIQNLTSEWSEDEEDAESSSQNETTISIVNEGTVPNEPDVEETIENIQQEVDNDPLEHERSDEPTVEDKPENVLKINNEIRPVAPETQEKISSLLNEWDENDSQEENEEVDESGDVNTEVQEVANDGNNKEIKEGDNHLAESRTVSVISSVVVETKKADIKNLVSDWDEEDDIQE